MNHKQLTKKRSNSTNDVSLLPTSNKFYKDLLAVFETEEFKTFRMKYMSDNSGDAESSSLYLISLIYLHKMHKSADSLSLLSIIHDIVRDRDTRLKLIKLVLGSANFSLFNQIE